VCCSNLELNSAGQWTSRTEFGQPWYRELTASGREMGTGSGKVKDSLDSNLGSRRSTCRSTSREVIGSDMIHYFERLFMHCPFRGPKVSKKSKVSPGLEFKNLCSQLLCVIQLWEYFHNFVYMMWVKNCMKLLPNLLSFFLESAGLWHA